MRRFIASAFRILFRPRFFRYSFFGFYNRIFYPFNLFKGVKKKILYRNQVQLTLDLEDWISQNLYFVHEYEEKEMKFITQTLQQGDAFIDIGANIGLFSLVASTTIGETGTVYAFEPFKRNYDVMQEHITLNKCKNIVLEKLAVSDKTATLSLYLNEKEKNNAMATAYSNTFTTTEEVSSVSIDAYLAAKHIPLRLVKLDIEGGEYLALKGMENTLKKYKPVLLLEINTEIYERTTFSPEAIERYLFDLGYKKHFLNDNGQIVDQKSANDHSHNYIFLMP